MDESPAWSVRAAREPCLRQSRGCPLVQLSELSSSGAPELRACPRRRECPPTPNLGQPRGSFERKRERCNHPLKARQVQPDQSQEPSSIRAHPRPFHLLNKRHSVPLTLRTLVAIVDLDSVNGGLHRSV